MSITVQKIVTKKRWTDSFEWKKPNPQEQEFLDKLLNVYQISTSYEMIEKYCKDFAKLNAKLKSTEAEIAIQKEPAIKSALTREANEIREKLAHIKRIVSRKLIVSAAKNYPEILSFNLEEFNPHALAYQEVKSHQNNPNLPLDYFGAFHKLINEKYGEGSDFHKKSGVPVSEALNYGDLLMPFTDVELDHVISYISNPASSSISEKSNKFYDEYFENVSKEDILKNGAQPNIDWLLEQKKNGKTPSGPSEFGE